VAKENDIFSSIKLEEAVKNSDLDGKETTEDDMILAGIGFNLAKIEGYKKRNNLTTVIDPKFKNKYPLDDVLYWYLKVVNENELKILKTNKSKFRKSQAEQIEKAEVLFLKEEPQVDSVSGYIEKNAELLKNNSELVQRNNELFKKIQELQEERDSLKEELNTNKNAIDILINGEQKLAKKLIQIFIQQKIKAELTIEEIELIKELSK